MGAPRELEETDLGLLVAEAALAQQRDEEGQAQEDLPGGTRNV